MTLPPTAQLLEFAHQHPLLMAALIVVFVLIVANELWGRLSAGPSVTTAQAVRMINDRNAVVLDVRQPAEYKKSHLMGAISMPLDKIDARASELARYKNVPVLVYCNLGNTSREAARKLREQGCGEVHSLRGGINGWMGSNLPVTAK